MDNLLSKFTWRIENFSQLEAEKLESLPFVVNENKLMLRLYPKGRDADQHLSLFLCVANSYSLPAEWSIPTKYSLSIINQIDPSKTIKIESENTFHSGANGWGPSRFIELHKLHDKSEGYLVEDTCLIEAEVYASPPSKDISGYIEAQSFLESLPESPICNSTPNAPTCEMPLFIKRDATFARQILYKLMSHRLDDLADPEHESAMMSSLSTLTDHLHLFRDAQAQEIVKLKATFPQTMQEWRESFQVKKDTSVHPWSTFEKAKCFLRELVKAEDEIKIELEDLTKKETELEAQLEVIQSKSQLLKEEREEISKQMKIFWSLALDKVSKIGLKNVKVDSANQLLEQRLKLKWVAMRHLFGIG